MQLQKEAEFLYTEAVQFGYILLPWPVCDQPVSSCVILLNECLIKLWSSARGEGKDKGETQTPMITFPLAAPVAEGAWEGHRKEEKV